MPDFYDGGATDYRKSLENEYASRIRAIEVELEKSNNEQRKAALQTEIRQLQMEFQAKLASINRSLF